MPPTNEAGHAITDRDDIFSDNSSDTKVASDSQDADQNDVKAASSAGRDAPNNDSDDRDYGSQVFWWLIAFRLVNATMIRTFFQPDEYFQALEPAWDIAFGRESGAWITWEWRHAMRSTVPPFMFGGLYWLSARLADFLQLDPTWRAELLLAAPKILQACIAAVGDYYTWKLGELAYGYGELGHWFALILTIANPFHFMVVTRTLANSTELALNAAALYLWFTSAPDDPTLPAEEEAEGDAANKDNEAKSENGDLTSSWITTKLEESTTKIKTFVAKQVRAYDLNRLRLCLVLAAVGCIIRVTNVLTWLILVSFEFLDYDTKWHFCALIPRLGLVLPLPQITPRLRELNHAHAVLVREAVLCGSVVLGLSVVLDKQYYGQWTLPALQFLHVNVGEGISNFYGTSDLSWYFTQGFPLLLGAFIIPALVQIRYYLFDAPRIEDDFPSIIKYEFSSIAVFVPLMFSFIAHKEARFIYPLIPILHTLAAGPAAQFFQPLLEDTHNTLVSHIQHHLRDRKIITRLLTGAIVLSIHVLIALVISLFHQAAPIDVLNYLRHEHEAHYLQQPPVATGIPTADTTMTVGFLMPCHSTPWRSHLVHPSIKAWALGCEPPLGLSATEKSVYRDEADQFYDAPEVFLERVLGKPKRTKGTTNSGYGWSGWKSTNEGFGAHGNRNEIAWDGKPGAKMWPEYLVFFAEKEELLGRILAGTNYVQCWRGWNTWWHDDWRRQGDMIVWCLRDKPLDLRVSEMGGVMARKMTRKIKEGARDASGG